MESWNINSEVHVPPRDGFGASGRREGGAPGWGSGSVGKREDISGRSLEAQPLGMPHSSGLRFSLWRAPGPGVIPSWNVSPWSTRGQHWTEDGVGPCGRWGAPLLREALRPTQTSHSPLLTPIPTPLPSDPDPACPFSAGPLGEVGSPLAPSSGWWSGKGGVFP